MSCQRHRLSALSPFPKPLLSKNQALFVMYLCLISLLILPDLALSSTIDVITYNAYSAGMGGAMSTLNSGAAAAYYNPAMLGFGYEKAVFEYGYFYAHPNLRFHVKGINDTYDPDEEKYESQIEEMLSFRRKTWEVEDPVSHIIGIASNIKSWFSAGVALQLPQHRIIRERFQLPSRPFFLDYDNRIQRLTILPSIAFKLPLGLSVGVSASVIADTKGLIIGKVPLGDPNRLVNISTDLTLTGRTYLLAGLAWQPNEQWRVGLAFRDTFDLTVTTVQEIETSYRMPWGQTLYFDIPLDIKATTLFKPRQITAGVSYHGLKRFMFALDITWHDWSKYIPPFPKIDIEYPDIIRPEEQPRVMNPDDPQIKPFWDFKDIIVPHLGIAWKAHPQITVMAGYSFEASPVPKQTGITTIIDGDTHIVSTGVSWKFWKDLRFAIFGQANFMKDVTAKKDESWLNDEDGSTPEKEIFIAAYPEFEAEATMYTIGATLTIQ